MGEEYITFLGRFHPLVVHLPIGFLLMAGLMQVISHRKPEKYSIFNPAIAFILLWGAISSIGAIAIGYLLSLHGSYDENTLFWHKWLGILLTILSFVGWYIKKEGLRFKKNLFYPLLGLILVLVSVTGHLGGNLTHGEGYLLHYAPKFIKNITGFEQQSKRINLTAINQDSILVYKHLIQPIFDESCVSCHNSSKKEGGLLLSSYHEVMEGGENGSIIDKKNPIKSELVNRLTLGKGHKKVMPPNGNLLSFGEVNLMSWWMQHGADSLAKFSDFLPLDRDISQILLRDYDLDFKVVPYYEKVTVDSVSTEIINELISHDFKVYFMGEKTNTISVSFASDTISINQLAVLSKAKEQITWLDLSGCGLTDESMSSLPELKNLTRLDLHGNPLTDEGIKKLIAMDHVTSINVYDTKVSSNGLDFLIGLPALKKMYVWKTNIENEYIEEMKLKYPSIEIIGNMDE